MLITPIASAFEQCSGMGLPGHLSKSNISTDNVTSHLDHKKMLAGQQSHQADIDCHTGNNCTVHICGGYGITSSTATVVSIISIYYSNHEYTSLYNANLSSDLRPPILAL